METKPSTTLRRELSDAMVSELRPHRDAEGNPKQREVFDTQQRGLLLRVNKSGKKSWRIHVLHEGRYTRIPLGDFNPLVLGVERARAAAALKLQELLAGADLSAQRRQQIAQRRAAAKRAKAPTLKVLLDRYAKAARDELPRTWEAQRSEMESFASDIGDRRVSMTAVKQLAALILAARDQGKASTARHHKAYFARPLRWASQQGWLNETDWDTLWRGITFKGRTQAYTPRERHLSIEELRALYAATEHMGGVYSAVYRALLLTGQRLSAVACATWEEIDTAKGLWIIPAERMKHLGRDHHIPLVGEFARLVSELREYADGDLIFPAPESGKLITSFAKGHKRLVADMKQQGVEVSHFTRHDIRRSVATLCEELEFMSPAVIDRWLGHTTLRRAESVSSVYGVYSKSRRTDAIERGMVALSDWFQADA